MGAATELVYLNVDDDELWRRIHGRGLEDPPVKRADLRAWRELFEVPDSEELTRYDASSTPTGRTLMPLSSSAVLGGDLDRTDDVPV